MFALQDETLSDLAQLNIVQPWQISPRELISWFDMLQFSAIRFFWCGRALRSIRCDCFIGAMGIFQGQAAFAMAKDLDQKARDKAQGELPPIEEEFRKIGLDITAETIKELVAELATDTRHSFEWLHAQIVNIESLAEKELKNKFFLYIAPERAKFWPTVNHPNLFGDEVADKFPSASFDIANSGTCIATMMPTAAVFHLMRVLEVGLTALGAVFEVSTEHTNWQNIIEQIESKIRNLHREPTWKALPDFKERQEFYAQAASHFALLKDAWRNQTMHNRAKYTETEAERIFENVKAFMEKLAERLKE